jgi:hypothetical protein
VDQGTDLWALCPTGQERLADVRDAGAFVEEGQRQPRLASELAQLGDRHGIGAHLGDRRIHGSTHVVADAVVLRLRCGVAVGGVGLFGYECRVVRRVG